MVIIRIKPESRNFKLETMKNPAVLKRINTYDVYKSNFVWFKLNRHLVTIALSVFVANYREKLNSISPSINF